MSDIKNPTSEADPGSLPTTFLGRPLRPWELAAKSWRTASGQLVDVEHATDAEFGALVAQTGMPIDDSGIPEWSFDDRVRFITYAHSFGIHLPFCDQNNSDSELFIAPQTPVQADGGQTA